MSQPDLWSINVNPQFRRSARMLGFGTALAIGGWFLWQLGASSETELLTMLGGLASLAGLVQTSMGVYRLAANVDVAAEAVYARHAAAVIAAEDAADAAEDAADAAAEAAALKAGAEPE